MISREIFILFLFCYSNKSSKHKKCPLKLVSKRWRFQLGVGTLNLELFMIVERTKLCQVRKGRSHYCFLILQHILKGNSLLLVSIAQELAYGTVTI